MSMRDGLGQRRGNLLDQLLLPLQIDGREELVLVNRLEQRLVLGLALLLGVGERGDRPLAAVEIELGGAALRQIEQLL